MEFGHVAVMKTHLVEWKYIMFKRLTGQGRVRAVTATLRLTDSLYIEGFIMSQTGVKVVPQNLIK